MSFANKFVKKMNEKAGEDMFKKASDFNINDTAIYYKTTIPVLNALLSDGDFEKGFPCNKIIVLAGEKQTGKSFIMRAMEDAFLKGNPHNILFKFDSEGATTNDMMEDFGMDTTRTIINTPKSVEEFRHVTTNLIEDYIQDKKKGKHEFLSLIADIKPKKAIKNMEEYIKESKGVLAKYVKDSEIIKEYPDMFEKMVEDYALHMNDEGFAVEAVYELYFPKIMITLDSLGLLPTEKEQTDARDNNNKSDMGRRAQLIKGLFRLLTNQSNLASIPMVIINHIYTEMSMYGTSRMSGGQGAYYAADIILFLYKKKIRNKVTKEQLGSEVRCKVDKSRFIKEGSDMIVEILFGMGLNRMSSIFELSLEAGLVKKLTSKSYQLDGSADKLSRDEVLPEIEKLLDNKEYMGKLSKYVYDKYSLFSKSTIANKINSDIDDMLESMEEEETATNVEQ